MSKYLFFDNASTTRCSESAFNQLKKFTTEAFGNPSSPHCFGKEASLAVQEARAFFANHFRVTPSQIIFTGSGTESDNLAVLGYAMGFMTSDDCDWDPDHPPRILISSVEHPAVRTSAESLKDFGFDVRSIPVLATGAIDEAALLELLTPETIFVSIMRVNNILGTLYPVETLASLVKSKAPQAVFHTDAVQAFGKVDLPKSDSDVDLISISGHKIQGPKGIGALIVLKESLLKRIRPLIFGGGQEGGMRSGTQSPGLISAFHHSAKEVLEHQNQSLEKTLSLRKILLNRLEKHLTHGKIALNSPENSIPYVLNFSILGKPSTQALVELERYGCLVATGSACSSGKKDPDPVLTAMRIPVPLQESSIRVSLCHSMSEGDMIELARAIESVSSKLQ